MILFGVIVSVYLVSSIITYYLYAYDKHMARHHKKRIPEVYIHLFEFIGGWPGGLIAQERIRHKNSKWQYQAIFWLIVGIHIIFWIYIIFWYPDLFINNPAEIPGDGI